MEGLSIFYNSIFVNHYADGFTRIARGKRQRAAICNIVTPCSRTVDGVVTRGIINPRHATRGTAARYRKAGRANALTKAARIYRQSGCGVIVRISHSDERACILFRF